MRAVVIIPTYNEADNIQRFLTQVRQDAPNTDILVVDDNSPDGTAKLAESVASQLGSIKVINRTGKRGYAAASREAIQSAIDSGYDVIATMDADFSHDPKTIQSFLRAIENGAEIVVGSRYIKNGMSVNWPIHRLLLSKWGNRYTAFMLKLKVHDCTTGFRAYTTRSMHNIEILKTVSQGYAFQSEIIFRDSMRGGRNIVEVPIRLYAVII